jgi:CHAT domain-containing protein
VVRLESQLLPGSQALPGDLMNRTAAALDSGTAFLAFRLGRSNSWLWALDREGAEVYRLPPAAEIETQVREASEAVRTGRNDAEAAGERLFDTLFGSLAPGFRAKARWLLALDAGLFDAPIAALVERTGDRRTYVTERRVTELVPGAGFWLDSAMRRSPGIAVSRFVGMGDAIYNGADPRMPRSNDSAAFSFLQRLTAASAAGVFSALPRLPGSGTELDACARGWSGPSTLLKGVDATRARLSTELARNPAAVHLAAHFVRSAQGQADAFLALSLTPANQPELVAASEIARWRIQTPLVVLSGCTSGGGAALPGTGLMGLTRAWLSAGARSVLASRWAVMDEEGSLFSAFYRNIRLSPPGQTRPAEALRNAQLQMIRSSSWRAHPRYWAAYFVVGDE